MKTIKKDLTIQGANEVDLMITDDFSSTFYVPEIKLRAAKLEYTGHQQEAEDNLTGDASEEERRAMRHITEDTLPTTIDLSKKFATTLLFTNIAAGKYELILTYRYKGDKCASPTTLTVKAWESG